MNYSQQICDKSIEQPVRYRFKQFFDMIDAKRIIGIKTFCLYMIGVTYFASISNWMWFHYSGRFQMHIEFLQIVFFVCTLQSYWLVAFVAIDRKIYRNPNIEWKIMKNEVRGWNCSRKLNLKLLAIRLFELHTLT